MNERRRKIIPLSPILLRDLFTTSDRAITIRTADGLPPRARFIAHGYDIQRDAHYLVFESDEWEPVPEFEMLPILAPQFVRYSVAPLLEQAAELIQGEDADPGRAGSLGRWLRDYEQFREVLE
jgi:hypothetical protein